MINDKELELMQIGADSCLSLIDDYLETVGGFQSMEPEARLFWVTARSSIRNVIKVSEEYRVLRNELTNLRVAVSALPNGESILEMLEHTEENPQ